MGNIIKQIYCCYKKYSGCAACSFFPAVYKLPCCPNSIQKCTYPVLFIHKPTQLYFILFFSECLTNQFWSLDEPSRKETEVGKRMNWKQTPRAGLKSRLSNTGGSESERCCSDKTAAFDTGKENRLFCSGWTTTTLTITICL